MDLGNAASPNKTNRNTLQVPENRIKPTPDSLNDKIKQIERRIGHLK